MKDKNHHFFSGIMASLASALFLGLAPIFGRWAILLGLPWQYVVAFRTAIAALLLLAGLSIFQRRYLYIYPAGLLGCLLAGGINGLGSLFYYGGLSRIEAGMGQLIYSLYPLFVALWSWLDHHPPSRLTIFRLGLILPAFYFLIGTQGADFDPVGVLLMLAASALYALHLLINQRVLYEMPAPTVTLYTLLAMSLIAIVPAGLLSLSSAPDGQGNALAALDPATAPLVCLALTTFCSRLALFTGVKRLGGTQTALLGLSELLITLFFAHTWLGESFGVWQWFGVSLLVASLGLVWLEKPAPIIKEARGWFSWVNRPQSSE